MRWKRNRDHCTLTLLGGEACEIEDVELFTPHWVYEDFRIPSNLLKQANRLIPTLPSRYRQSVIDLYVNASSLLDLNSEELRHLGLSQQTVEQFGAEDFNLLQEQVSLLDITLDFRANGQAFHNGAQIIANGSIVDPWSRVWTVGDDYVDGFISLDEYKATESESDEFGS